MMILKILALLPFAFIGFIFVIALINGTLKEIAKYCDDNNKIYEDDEDEIHNK